MSEMLPEQDCSFPDLSKSALITSISKSPQKQHKLGTNTVFTTFTSGQSYTGGVTLSSLVYLTQPG